MNFEGDDAPIPSRGKGKRQKKQKGKVEESGDAFSSTADQDYRQSQSGNGWAGGDDEPQQKLHETTSVTYVDQTDNFAVALQDGDDITNQVAEAPAVHQQKIHTLNELNSLITSAQPIQMSSGGVNMSVLISSIFPPDLVEEYDEPWDHSTLLKDITQEMQSEKTSGESSLSHSKGASSSQAKLLSSTASSKSLTDSSSNLRAGPPRFTQTMIAGKPPI
ncbi:putative Intraflagellar transport protein 43 [Monocercomonoides exilis]|uniref:putative Intraflagellar transport protein 43 n=1 Tax=Monocercomonoides exilis TaxID=2049356 RepID=UPI003559C513|nr:putative Intraflagellar transport protein 43 [Monocercomonoides exilis]|eukprot:MONOS_2666.1-p1 / transcript=MONOS_2666.1 / gene=MONOS_2666 / organism=Monocercomonoides_exilis_PA203 / gene_product=unspecified product / transcript_product=unspecified product / location=Mono_scaffold00056:61990-62837(-) / protein_length=218 / sequence_SO=supercontig / SO=protein_coding / is_pseudo=false